jgi:TPR repeat protein
VTSQGSAPGRFQGACKNGHVRLAEEAARELGNVSLAHALALLSLYARTGSEKFEPAAVRWLRRLALEGHDVGLSELQLAAAALGCLRGPRRDRAEETLRRLL